MLRYLKTFFIVVLLLAALSGPVSAFNSQRKDVWVIDGGKPTVYWTTAEYVNEFLDEIGVNLAANDIIDVDLNDKLDVSPRISKIKITRGFDVMVTIDGTMETVPVKEGSYVGTMIADLEEQYGKEFYYDGYLAAVLEPNQKIVLQTREEQTITGIIVVPFETEEKLIDTLDEGVEEVVQQGVVGKKQVITKVIYLSGEETERYVLEEKEIQKPVNKIVHKGTRKEAEFVFAMKKEINDIAFSKEYTMNATAYTAGYESTGKRPGDKYYGITASGLRVRPGIVAVDPRVIPLGTKLYVEGYGYSLAADTGGAIKGNKIDLFFESVAEARKFGRKNIKVYVLANQG